MTPTVKFVLSALEVPNDKSEMVEATPEQIDEMLSP